MAQYDIYDGTMSALYREMCDRYVPISGKADTEFGEELRAAGRVLQRYSNDGDIAHVGYGQETVDPALEFLLQCEDPGLRAAAESIDGLTRRFLEDADGDDPDYAPYVPLRTVQAYERRLCDLRDVVDAMCMTKRHNLSYLDTPRPVDDNSGTFDILQRSRNARSDGYYDPSRYGGLDKELKEIGYALQTSARPVVREGYAVYKVRDRKGVCVFPEDWAFEEWDIEQDDTECRVRLHSVRPKEASFNRKPKKGGKKAARAMVPGKGSAGTTRRGEPDRSGTRGQPPKKNGASLKERLDALRHKT